ncbi:MAG: xanthine dehydrogenase family protein molybdopterin-binding subunit [Planctomycetes bacterium]|nr:xanthine dehydrogenase family protein molybdopterin-binding subunit [Planctomycetota bacterium]
MSFMQEEKRPGKKKIKTTRVVNGLDVEEEVWVDDLEAPLFKPREECRLLGTRMKRVDGPAKLTGAAEYTSDVRLEGMLYAKVLLCPFGRAKVKIDAAPALASKGCVHARQLVDETKYLGQPVAVVAAATPELAEDALRALVVEYEPLPWVLDRGQALAEGAPEVRSRGNLGRPTEDGDAGEVEAAFAQCAVVVEQEYSVPVQHHVCLETHGTVVDYRGGEDAIVYCSTQSTHGIVGDAAESLGLRKAQVRGIVQHMGGGFGSKFGLERAGTLACEISREQKRPVHLMWNREAEFLTSGNRTGAWQRVKAGANKDGRMLAMSSDVERYGGIGGGSHAGLPYLYSVEKSLRKHASVYMHLDTNCAMRAPGHPQASFAMESVVDELAAGLGMDAVEFRKRNLNSPAHLRQLDRVAELIGWNEHPNRTAPGSVDGFEAVGIGFGCSRWGVGGSPVCQVDVRVMNDGSVTAEVGSQDLGTGTRTYLAAIVAEELGRPLDGVQARLGDSRMGNANGSGGSTTTPSLAPAVQDAARQMRGVLSVAAAEHFGCAPEEVVLDPDGARAPGGKLTWLELCALLPPEGASVRGTWQSDLAVSGVACTQAARVRVDLLTGRVKVEKMVCLQECGRPLNRLALESQIRGAMTQALSYALLEERRVDPQLGIALSADLETYKIAGSLEIPEFVALVDDDDLREGVAGVGEPPVIPGAGAIANAVFNACGVRLRHLPLTPDKVLNAIEERKSS